jgi:hypothetical protein
MTTKTTAICFLMNISKREGLGLIEAGRQGPPRWSPEKEWSLTVLRTFEPFPESQNNEVIL